MSVFGAEFNLWDSRKHPIPYHIAIAQTSAFSKALDTPKADEEIEEREGKKISCSEGLSLAFKTVIRRRGTSKAFRKLIGYCLGGDFHHKEHMLPMEKITKLYALYQTREELGLWDDACIKIVLELDDIPIEKIAALRKLWFCHLKYRHLKTWKEENTQQIIHAPGDGMDKAEELIANITRSEAEREKEERAQREERERAQREEKERAQREAFNEERRRRRNNRNQERANTKKRIFTPREGEHPGLFEVPVRAVSDEQRKELHELKQHLRMFKVTVRALVC